MSQPPNYDAWHREHADDTAEHQGYDDAEVSAQDHDLWGRTTQEAPERRRSTGRPDWFAPVMVMVAALVALSLAYVLTRHSNHDDSAVTQPSMSSVAPSAATGAPSGSQSPSSGASDAPSTAGAPTSAPSGTSSESSETSTADFPAGSVATCGDGEAAPSADVRLAQGTHSSCGYVEQVLSAVTSYASQNPTATSFTVSPYSPSLSKVVPLTCTRERHLSTCVGGNDVHLWVRDSAR